MSAPTELNTRSFASRRFEQRLERRSQQRPERRPERRPGAIHAALALSAFACFIVSLALAAPAHAASGTAEFGGSGIVLTPKIKTVKCLRSCAAKKRVRGGSLIRLAGIDMRTAHTILFLGSRGAEDDAQSPVIKAGSKSIKVRVPADAATGPIVALGANGARSKANFLLAVLPAPPVIASPDLQTVENVALPQGVTLETGTSTPRVVFLGAKHLVRFSLRVSGADATAAVSLIRQSTGEAVAGWTIPAPAGQIASVDWDGNVAGAPAANGRYVFTVSVSVAGATTAAAASAPRVANSDLRNAFDLYGHMFPVRGKHDFGGYAAKFGGGRGHQGQDVFAKCGTKLVAARGGTVIESRFQSRAGNFVVIRPDGGGDMAYMHLASKSPFQPGDRVYTGQTIGNVGQTGRASGCHLHFEIWTGEIWRSKPVDPLPDLLAWDQVS